MASYGAGQTYGRRSAQVAQAGVQNTFAASQQAIGRSRERWDSQQSQSVSGSAIQQQGGGEDLNQRRARRRARRAERERERVGLGIALDSDDRNVTAGSWEGDNIGGNGAGERGGGASQFVTSHSVLDYSGFSRGGRGGASELDISAVRTARRQENYALSAQAATLAGDRRTDRYDRSSVDADQSRNARSLRASELRTKTATDRERGLPSAFTTGAYQSMAARYATPPQASAPATQAVGATNSIAPAPPTSRYDSSAYLRYRREHSPPPSRAQHPYLSAAAGSPSTVNHNSTFSGLSALDFDLTLSPTTPNTQRQLDATGAGVGTFTANGSLVDDPHTPSQQQAQPQPDLPASLRNLPPRANALLLSPERGVTSVVQPTLLPVMTAAAFVEARTIAATPIVTSLALKTVLTEETKDGSFKRVQTKAKKKDQDVHICLRLNKTRRVEIHVGESYEPEFRFAVERVFAVYVAPDDTLAPEALVYLPILSTVRSADHRELVVTAGWDSGTDRLLGITAPTKNGTRDSFVVAIDATVAGESQTAIRLYKKIAAKYYRPDSKFEGYSGRKPKTFFVDPYMRISNSEPSSVGLFALGLAIEDPARIHPDDERGPTTVTFVRAGDLGVAGVARGDD